MEPANRQFLEVSATCPLCDAAEIAYEFVVAGVAYSGCRACSLLFANPRPAVTPLMVSAQARAMVRQAVVLTERYAQARPQRVAIVGHVQGSSIENIPALSPKALESETAPYDLLIVLGGVERVADPHELLQQIGRKLAGNGTLALLYPSVSSPGAILQRDRWVAFHEKLGYFFTPDTIQSLATRCGFGDFQSYVDARDTGASDQGVTGWFGGGALMLCRPAVGRKSDLLSVIFPVYNERATVEESLQRVLRKEIPGIEIEIIVVESNSTDGSREIVERYREHPRVRIVHEDRPRGKGHAVRTGLKHASGEVILFQDADLEYDVGDYESLVAPLFELKRNFVLGSRHDARGQAWKIRHFERQQTLSSVVNLAHLFLLWMFNRLYRQSLQDPFTMYKVFRRDCLYGLTFHCDRFDFDYEISIKLLRKGYQPLEIPINYVSRPFSEGKKVSFFGDPPTWIRAMLKLRRARLYER
jgi:hypothetical protein